MSARNAAAIVVVAALLGGGLASHASATAPATDTSRNTPPVGLAPGTSRHDSVFQPPPLTAIPKNQFGTMVRLGQRIFEDPARYARPYVGNELRCSNCHLAAGRLAGSAPMWAAYVSYPAYRSKNHRVNTFAERLQGCFRYSMNGRKPPLGGKVLVALESYAYWMARGARLDPKIAGRGYPKISKPPRAPSYSRGQRVYDTRCAMCHGADGQGQPANDGSPAFPALWGPQSFNWGAGMGSLKNAAPFIKANMPLGLGGSLSVQDAWDVALFVDSHERPQDPRFTGSVAETRRRFHHSRNSMYGTMVDGHLLGSGSVPAGGG